MQRQNPTHPGEGIRLERQRGTVVVYLVLALVVFGVMAMAGATRFGASILGVGSPNCSTQARLMAESGVRYAMARLRTATDQATLMALIAALNGQTYTVDAAKGLAFTLTVTSGGSGIAQVSSSGSACGGAVFLPSTSTQASASVNVPAASGSGEIFPDSLAQGLTINVMGGAGPISVSGNTIYMGIIGQGRTAAAIWYSGNSTSCLNGVCTMTYGLRSYFETQWNSTSHADGMVFGVISGLTNTVTSCGGDPDMGELMGWAGPGPNAAVDGLRPPKIGLELDTWRNKANTPVYNADSRADTDYLNTDQTTGNRDADHLAYVFWGSDASVSFNKNGTQITSTTYDDNRHAVDSTGSAGAGNASEPISYSDLDGNGDGRYGYFHKAAGTWLKDGTQYKFRYELSRLGTKNSAGEYAYDIKTWVHTGTVSSAYQNVNANYTTEAPDMYRVVFLTPALHAQLAKVIVGFTEATGAATQRVALTGFNLSFKNAADTLTIPNDYVSYWNMNAVSGTNVPNANATMPGTIVPAAANVPVVTPASYSYGKALSFAADAGRVTVADAASLDLTTTGAIAAWIFPTTLGAASDDTHILHKGDRNNQSDEAYGLRLSSGGKLQLLIRYGNNNGNTVTVESLALPAANRWYHVVAQWSADVLAIYINGTLSSIATNANARAAQNTAGPLLIGAEDNQSAPFRGFNGYIDEVYLFKRLLTAEEIAAMALMP